MKETQSIIDLRTIIASASEIEIMTIGKNGKTIFLTSNKKIADALKRIMKSGQEEVSNA